MLLLSKLTLAIVLAVVVQCVDGNQRIINVNELISDDYDFFASGAYDNSHICCVCGNCSCNSLDHALANLTSNVLINITTDVTLSSMVRVSHQLADVSIIGHNNPTVNCKNVGGLRFTCLNCVIQGITWDGCGTTSINNNTEPGLNLDYCYNITIQSCSFWRSVGPAVILRNVLGDVNINNCKFMNNNHYIGHGAAIQYSFLFPRSSLDFFTITNCNFSYNKVKSLVYLESRSTYFHRYHKTIFINSTFSNNQGISIHVFNHNIYFTGKVLFQNNTAENGAGIYISDHSTVTFDKNSDVKFIQNSADHRGSAIFLRKNSVGLFDQNSVVTFNNNKVTNGTIYCEDSSNVIFKGTCQVTFSGNSATQHGAAIHSVNNSHVTITDNSKVTLKHNFISYDGYKLLSPVGGIITSYDNCNINFEGNSITMFANNIANSGGAIYTRNGYVTFEGHSSTMFNNNVAKSEGGAIVSYNSHISFDRNSTTVFTENAADLGGAIMCIFSNISFEGNTTFKNNKATNGTIFSQDNSNVIFRGNCKAFFIGNSAVQYGGAVCSSDNSHITFTEHSNVTFTNNTGHYGGAILAHRNSIVSFKDNSAVVFINNDANSFGGAIFSGVYSIVKFQDSSIVRFTHNAAHNGGALVSTEYSSVVYNDNTRVTHYHNKARHNGGVFYSLRSTLHFDGNSTISLIYNEAVQNGGVMHLAANSEVSFLRFADVTFNYNNAIYGGALSANDESKILFKDNSMVTFYQNEAQEYGGAGYFDSNCNITFNEKTHVIFEDNDAHYGGAIFLDNNTNIQFTENSTTLFKNNWATRDGGAINVFSNSNVTVEDFTTITFTTNNAQYGAAMFFDVTQSSLVFHNHQEDIFFINNVARIAGRSLYFDSSKSCNTSCLNNRIINGKNKTKYFIATPPSKLKFYDPATCIDNDNKTECNTYYLKHVMLGGEINIPACVLDYNNQNADTAQFLLHEETKQNYSISGSKQVLLSCDTFQGISIIGNKSLSKSLNYSFNITLNDDRKSNWKQISVNLTVELVPCYSGFWHYSNSKKCKCYNRSNIMFCSGSSSTIKRGYWFGSVMGKPTVTFCPINYCNFACCKASNGYYQLSPERVNQCRSHRSGTACGSCTDGYTLSFDSTECVSVDSCTAGQKILVILLTVTYWIVMVTIVFVMMYYKVGIGYLYSITYYYSIVDILLSQNLQASRGLYLTVSIMSSLSKITPQFLGELCLTTGMSGIDQQFIHYIHPSAVIMILVAICLLARSSHRFSAFISRGIINVICLLLLLSYTCMASTSLLLMRPIKFLDIDEVYTYLSPDIEYLHGHHLAYGIVALICTVTIVLGLPLLLMLEPLLNHKINFVKIKPLLDQFQGCYKDKYRCFAGYYMTCRLVIITIVIANPSNEFIASYLLIAVCGVIALLHVLVKPYSNRFLNKFDGVILHFIIFITALPLLDDFDSPLVIGIAFVLVILPWLNFIVMTLFLHKNDLKKIITHFKLQDKSTSSNTNDDNNNEVPKKEFHLIVDDSMSKNAIICDINQPYAGSNSFRESFLNIMDEIQN